MDFVVVDVGLVENMLELYLRWEMAAQYGCGVAFLRYDNVE